MGAPAASSKYSTRRRPPEEAPPMLDLPLVYTALALLGLGLVMMASASFGIADSQLGQPHYFLLRQAGFVAFGLFVATLVLHVPLGLWERMGTPLLAVSMALLVLVLIPGIGREVNGSARWLSLGLVNVQPSELAKLFAITYLAGYLLRHGDELRRELRGFLKPVLVLALVCVLLLAEPDFGAAAVLMVTALGMMFLGGVRLWQFAALLGLVTAALAVLAISSPYRVERITGFLDPWSDPFASGFQLTQALIAFGRGEWLGVGLGSSIQKLFYLPEAHTDFLFAVIAEELGLIGSLSVIGLFAFMVWRAFRIGRRAELAQRPFGAYMAYGLAIWLGLQAFTNMGVNMGLLPTKGLTLPLMSYGGSSLVVACVAVALLLRVEHETREALAGRAGRR